jgi:hypothetical protein
MHKTTGGVPKSPLGDLGVDKDENQIVSPQAKGNKAALSKHLYMAKVPSGDLRVKK